RELRLGAEHLPRPRDEFAMGRRAFRKDLDRDLHVKNDVVCEPDLAHRAAPEEASESISTPDHGACERAPGRRRRRRRQWWRGERGHEGMRTTIRTNDAAP